MSTNKVTVQMGSRQLKVEINSLTTSQHLIEIVLCKCKIDKKIAKSYAVFENISNIERQLHSNETVLKTNNKNVKFIVRKYSQTKKQLPDCCQDKIKQYYRRLNKKTDQSTVKVIDDSEKQNYMQIILKNERELEEQIIKLQELENSSEQMCDINDNQLTARLATQKLDNINFLQFLYYKLKKQSLSSSDFQYETSSSDYVKLIDNNSCGNSSDEETASVNISYNEFKYESLV